MPGGKGNIKPSDNPKPFKKGVVNNPNGRPKGISFKTTIQRLLSLTQKKTNPITGEVEELTILDQMTLAQVRKALEGKVDSFKELADRLEGKSVAKNENKNEGSIEINVNKKIID